MSLPTTTPTLLDYPPGNPDANPWTAGGLWGAGSGPLGGVPGIKIVSGMIQQTVDWGNAGWVNLATGSAFEIGIAFAAVAGAFVWLGLQYGTAGGQNGFYAYGDRDNGRTTLYRYINGTPTQLDYLSSNPHNGIALSYNGDRAITYYSENTGSTWTYAASGPTGDASFAGQQPRLVIMANGAVPMNIVRVFGDTFSTTPPTSGVDAGTEERGVDRGIDRGVSVGMARRLVDTYWKRSSAGLFVPARSLA